MAADDEETVIEKQAKKGYFSKRQIMEQAISNEKKLTERMRWMYEQACHAIENERQKLNGMTRLLGCMVVRHGAQVFPYAEIEAMDPGRMFVADRTEGEVRTWTADIRDDSSKPVEVYVGPENMPEEALDLEAMARDGVTEVKVPREEMH